MPRGSWGLAPAHLSASAAFPVSGGFLCCEAFHADVRQKATLTFSRRVLTLRVPVSLSSLLGKELSRPGAAIPLPSSASPPPALSRVHRCAVCTRGLPHTQAPLSASAPAGPSASPRGSQPHAGRPHPSCAPSPLLPAYLQPLLGQAWGPGASPGLVSSGASAWQIFLLVL